LILSLNAITGFSDEQNYFVARRFINPVHPVILSIVFRHSFFAAPDMPVCYCARLLQWRISTQKALQGGISSPMPGCINGNLVIGNDLDMFAHYGRKSWSKN